MKPNQTELDRWQRIEQLFHATLERNANERESFLAAACAGDEELRGEVESLLRYDALTEHFIETPAMEDAMRDLAARQAPSSDFKPAADLPALDQLRRAAAGGASDSSSITLGSGRFVAGTMLADRYRIIGLLGRGGMGEVYKAEDLRLEQAVALKFLPDALALDGAMLARFRGEARTARRISHPNICRVYDIGEDNGLHFISMEFIDGEDLASLLRRIGRLPGDKAVEVARQLCAGLAAAHDLGVMHRDLKPANIMIDGRGRARITDFGLAVVSAELRDSQASAGTPAYMAPEQLTGREVTPRSDIYALGLVLFELFTGKRVFEAKTIGELMRLHERSTPPTPSDWVKEIDPLAERVIMRCLEKDPQRRPVSAMHVTVALPGSDPLQAALAMGETPSPEMVAAAGEKTGLRPKVAVSCLAAVIVGLIIIALVDYKVTLLHKVMSEHSPEELAHKAHDIIQRLGYTDRPADTAYGLDYDYEYLPYVRREGARGNRWNQLTTGQPAAIYCWYRESPQYLISEHHYKSPWEDTPPMFVSGMVNVRLDGRGRLIKFEAVPPQVDQSNEAAPAPDWTALFTAAGLDPARFTPAEPNWTPLAPVDARAAWTGKSLDQSEIPLRIEAAAWRGKPVYFQLIWPWTSPSRMPSSQTSPIERIGGPNFSVLSFALIIGAALLARHNLRQGRGDRRGAFKLSILSFSSLMLYWLFFERHAPSLIEMDRIYFGLAIGLYSAVSLWVVYIALEPFLRRRWPTSLISWNRSLNGKLRDPLVGRDLLVGILFNVGFAVMFGPIYLAYVQLGELPGRMYEDRYTLSGAPQFIMITLSRYGEMAILSALLIFFMLFLLRALTRREWLAVGAFVMISSLIGATDPVNPVFTALLHCCWALFISVILLRFGLVSAVAYCFVDFILGVSIATDFSAWHAPRALSAIIMVLALAAYGFHTSLGGQKLFQGRLLEE